MAEDRSILDAIDEIIAETPVAKKTKKKGHKDTKVAHHDGSEWRYYGLPFYPLSHNNAYGSGFKGKRFLIREYEEYKNAITDLVRIIDNENDVLKLQGRAYEVRLVAVLKNEAMFYGNGNFRKFDVDGLIKLAQDALFTYIAHDDSTILGVRSEKVAVKNLPFDERRYSENPVWDLKGGVLCIGIRAVPLSRVYKLHRDDDPQLLEMIKGCKTVAKYAEPKLNMRRGKKEQARRAQRDAKKMEQLAKQRKTKGDRR